MIATAIFPTEATLSEEIHMAERERKNWRELCNAALEANDPDDELLKILQETQHGPKKRRAGPS
jgi:hypothetical protein